MASSLSLMVSDFMKSLSQLEISPEEMSKLIKEK